MMKNPMDHADSFSCETLFLFGHCRIDESAAGFTVVQLYPSVLWIPISTLDATPSPLSAF